MKTSTTSRLISRLIKLSAFIIAFGIFSTNRAAAQNCQANFNYSTSGSTVSFANTSTASGASISQWSFGDGGYSYQTNPNHTYANGSYWVCLYTYDSTYSCSDSTCQYITINNGTGNCDASFTAYPDTANQVGFYPSSTNRGLFYYWTFGDGASSNLQYPYHQYSSPGTYLACLYVYDSLQTCSDSLCQYITVNSGTGNCDASFTTYPDTANHVGFYPNSTNRGLFYYWTFGDGNYSYQQYPYHQFANPGTYLACLYVYDSIQTCSDSICQYITVGGISGCQASFSLYPDTSSAFAAYFYSTSTPSTGLTYFWTFGDGTTSTSQYAQHTYSTPGNYLVCLAIYNPNTQCSDSICANITVSQANGVQMISMSVEDDKEIGTDISSYPNPFSEVTNISYTITKKASVSVSVYDMIGKEVANLKNNIDEQSGKQTVKWDATGFGNGIYLVTIKIDEKLYTQKLILNNN